MANLRKRTSRQNSRHNSVQSQSSALPSPSSQPTRRSERLQSREGSVASDLTLAVDNDKIRSEQRGTRYQTRRQQHLPAVPEATDDDYDNGLSVSEGDSHEDEEDTKDDDLEEDDLETRQLSDLDHTKTVFVNLPHRNLSPSISSNGNVSKSEEIELLRDSVDSMIDQLPDLLSAAYTLLNPLVPEHLNEDVIERLAQDIRERPGLWQRRQEGLATVFKEYGNNDFIQPKLIIPAMIDVDSFEEARQAAWRPDDVIFVANLAEFAFRLMSVLDEASLANLHWLSSIEALFPAQFVTGVMKRRVNQLVPVGFSQLHAETRDIALDLRTQLYIIVLGTRVEETNCDPLKLLQEVFLSLTSPTRGIRSADELLYDEMKQWQIPGLSSESTNTTNKITQQVIATRVGQITEFFNFDHVENGLAHTYLADYVRLREFFPFASMRLRCMQWIRKRFDELQVSIRSYGGVHEITKALKNTGDPRRSPEKPNTDQEKLDPSPQKLVEHQAVNDYVVNPSTDTFRKQNPDALRSLKRLSGRSRDPSARVTQQEHLDRANMSSLATSNGNEAISDDAADVLPAIEDENIIVLQSTPSRAATLSVVGPSTLTGTLSKQGNPPGKMFERQPGAHRVSPIREANTPRAGDEAQDDSDADYQLEAFDRQIAEKKRKREEFLSKDSDIAQVNKRNGRQLEDRVKDAAAVRAKTSRTDQIQNQDETRQRSVENQDVEDSGDVIQDYQDIKANARRILNITRNSRRPRTNTPWTEAEEDELMRLIELKDCRYAAIEAHDKAGKRILVNRSQGNLRDHARTMKRNYILAGEDVPPGFDFVKLNKKNMDEIAEAGIMYEQGQSRQTRAIDSDE